MDVEFCLIVPFDCMPFDVANAYVLFCLLRLCHESK